MLSNISGLRVQSYDIYLNRARKYEKSLDKTPLSIK